MCISIFNKILSHSLKMKISYKKKQTNTKDLLRVDFGNEFSGKNMIQGTATSCSTFKLWRWGRTRSSEYGVRNHLNALFPEKQLLKQPRNCLKFHYSLSNLLHDPRKKDVHKGGLTLCFSLCSLNHSDLQLANKNDKLL